MNDEIEDVEKVKDLLPVILGGDIGAYSLAREFFEAYRVKSTVISGVSTGIMRHSKFLKHVVFNGMEDDEKIIDKLLEIADKNTNKNLIVVASADWLVKVLVTHQKALRDAGYTVPYADVAAFETLTTKAGFYEACERLGVPYPKTKIVPIPLESDAPLDLGKLTFPLIAKASSTSAYHDIKFEGKKKVHIVDDRQELEKLLKDVETAGYVGDFIIQDYIPGDDSGMRILTCYCDREGKVRFSAYGEVLLEDHAPGALGNPVAIITKENPAAVKAATRILEDIGWKGYANFDLKYDPRDGKAKFFELNPRLGRSNYYIAAAGANPVKYYVQEWMRGKYPTPITVLGGHVPLNLNGDLAKHHLYTVVPLALLNRYLFNAKQREQVKKLVGKHSVTNPMRSRFEHSPRRRFYVTISQLNQFRKFHKFYPRRQARKLFNEAHRST